MCGIFCSVSRHDHIPPSPTIEGRLKARGPDAANQILVQCPIKDDLTTTVTCYSTVLSLRGQVTTVQPLQKAVSGSVLCWNGEAWAVDGERLQGNDTERILDLLTAAVDQSAASSSLSQIAGFGAQLLSRALSRIEGPYAFVFYDASKSRLYFGRDFLGRRSLLWRCTASGDLLLSSVSDESSGDAWAEVEADGIYCLDLASQSRGRQVNVSVPNQKACFSVTKLPYALHDEQERSNLSVIPRLFLNRRLDSGQAPLGETSASVSCLRDLLYDSLRTRVLNIPDSPSRTDTDRGLTSSRLAILFSGGLDCTTLARISHDLLSTEEPLDLLNVAFENPRIHKEGNANAYELCPDRITGRESYAELCRVCPSRQWRFVAINIPYTEMQAHRANVIALMHPHNTEMDLSIALAFYFAARGSGIVSTVQGELQPYTTSARVLLSGLGADELFAGYTRHVTAFKRGGHAGLLDELDLDIGRLGKRNLGRDDRVISHWGREVRFAFLDERVIAWALEASVHQKCDFGCRLVDGDCTNDQSVCLPPDKKVLRCLAWRLGMRNVAWEKKRAIQFGARTAKMETGKTKGTTVVS